MPAFQDPKSATLARLREQLWQFRPQYREFRTSGCPVLDRVLPGNGLPDGGIVEWLGRAGGGATTLSLRMARQICQDEGLLAVVDRRQRLYPPALAALGIDLNRTLLLHPPSHRDEIWSLIQCLRCPSIAVTWGFLKQLDSREYRCLQLAAEAGGGAGMLVQPAHRRGQPTWADVQLLVTPQKGAGERRRFAMEVVNCRQGPVGKSVTVDLDVNTGELRECDEPFPVSVASQLAHSPAGGRATRTR